MDSLNGILTGLTFNYPELSERAKVLTSNYQNLMIKLKDVADTISQVSGPVRVLETQKSNAIKILDKVDQILTFQEKLSGLKSAMREGQLSIASRICGELNETTIPYHISEVEELERLKSELCSTVQKKFGEAIAENDKGKIEMYAGLFLPLGLGREGIDRYIQYINASLISQIKAAVELLGKDAEVKHEEVLVRIFRCTVKVFDTHQEAVQKEFGNLGVIDLLQSLQRESDQQAVRIYNQFLSEKGLHITTQIIRNPNFTPAQADSLCEDIAKILKHSESFETHINKIGKGVVSKAQNFQPQPGISNETGLLRISGLKSKIQELADIYISLETYYMMNSVKNSLGKLNIQAYIEQSYQAKDNLTSGSNFEVLDEIFFIIQKCEQRGLATLNINSVCAILNHIGGLLSEDIIDQLSKKIPGSRYGISGSASLSSQFTTANAGLIISLNLLETTRAYSKKLSAQVEQKFKKIYGEEGNEVDMFKHCLSSIFDASEKARILEQDILKSTVSGFQGQVNNLLNPFLHAGYELSEETYADYQVNDPFVLKLIKEIKGQLKQWRYQMMTDLFEMTLDLITQTLVELIEYNLKNGNKKFNELGALQFTRDIREISIQLQGMTNKPLRQRFVRLKQIGQVLQAKNVEEVEGFIKERDWRITQKDTLAYWRLRI
ncbi:unnamed protein product [Blepharisma stoltei]|uniref:Conserved oligomeric Golgi complex subunit 4 n=1 Tax=Blepharisma stoltei TaxID=1481888 RepID=A0AAU9J6T2_9CILI|nr:unnamed protein product [Blepharisma stoltei]